MDRGNIRRMAPCVALLLAACTNPYDPGQRALGGGLLGAGTGAAIGGIAGGNRGAAMGALAGGLGGAALGIATTPQPPVQQGGYGAPQPYYAPQPGAHTYYPAPTAAAPYYPPPGPGYVAAPYPYANQGPPPQSWQPPPGTYWQPQPYGGGYSPPEPSYYRY